MQLPIVHRRQFLKLATIAAAGVALGERKLFAAGSSGIVPLLGVGYAPSLPQDGFSVPMMDASANLSPDPTFLRRGARVTVVGGARSKQGSNIDGGIAMDAYFPITGRDPEKYPRFSFWSVTGDSQSGAVSFRVPAVATTGLTFVARRVLPTAVPVEPNTVPPLEMETSPITLSLGSADGPRLTRGVYAFAFREGNGDSTPNWSRLLLINQKGQYSLSGAGVTYLLMQIDYDPEPVEIPAAPSRGRASRH